MTQIRSGEMPPFLSRLCSCVAVVSLLASCSSIPQAPVAPPAVAIEAPAPPANFNIAAGELDTWNAIGQLLVRMDGVTYQGRAQKLGLYDVKYRGESFLILTRALPLSTEIKFTTTEVRTALQTGKANSSAPAIELLGLLQARLPAELVRIASEKREALAKKNALAKKKPGKPAARKKIKQR